MCTIDQVDAAGVRQARRIGERRAERDVVETVAVEVADGCHSRAELVAGRGARAAPRRRQLSSGSKPGRRTRGIASVVLYLYVGLDNGGSFQALCQLKYCNLRDGVHGRADVS